MAQFPRFDFGEFERKTFHTSESLGALGSLGGRVVDFAKYCQSPNEDERMELEERAAIMEYDGGLSREQAEIQALQNVIYMKGLDPK
jgi:hypothetical protein